MDHATREAVRKRALGRCEYCQLPEEGSGLLPFHVEHVRATQHRGTDALDNLCYACSRCNHFKGPNVATYDPETDELVRLFDPRRDVWDDHFRREGPVIAGATPMGRATVELLQMNERRRLELRASLRDEDEQ
jgi:hypothetical protein